MTASFRSFAFLAALLGSAALLCGGCSTGGSGAATSPGTLTTPAAPRSPAPPAVTPPTGEQTPAGVPVRPPAADPAPAQPAGPGQQGRLTPPVMTRNVVVIGWDGAQREHVKALLEKAKLPELQRLRAEGTMVDIDIHGTTDTKAGWSEILTGCRAETTGVHGNARFGPIPAGLTLFERLKRHYGGDGVFTAAVVGKRVHVDADAPRREATVVGDVEDPDGAGPEAERVQADAEGRKDGKKARVIEPGSKLVVENGVQYREWPAKPFFTAREAGPRAGLDVWVNGLGSNERVGERALELIKQQKDRPFCIFVHFAEVDHQGHRFGENSDQYTEALISSDKWTGRIVDRLRELRILDHTLVCVTADHGFDEGRQSHRSAPFVFLAANDRSVLRAGTRTDITPTILALLGLDPAKADPPVDGRTLTRPLPEGEKLPAVKSQPPPGPAQGAKPGKAGKEGKPAKGKANRNAPAAP
ncbi:MAG TPA: alkaline phosphatase family protein [Planctomycetota bacterium]|nr:alkaline phosphatase family protein [Planctomycetota bacterium]